MGGEAITCLHHIFEAAVSIHARETAKPGCSVNLYNIYVYIIRAQWYITTGTKWYVVTVVQLYTCIIGAQWYVVNGAKWYVLTMAQLYIIGAQWYVTTGAKWYVLTVAQLHIIRS